jgi:hypothetical protein
MWGKRAAALFMVAIMIGAGFYAALNDLPNDDDLPAGRNVLVWDMNIYAPRKAGGNYHGSALSLGIVFPATTYKRSIELKNAEVEVGYEVVDLLDGFGNSKLIQRSKGIVDGNSILYPDVFDGVDLEFRGRERAQGVSHHQEPPAIPANGPHGEVPAPLRPKRPTADREGGREEHWEHGHRRARLDGR